MADIKDITTVLASALAEASVNGTLDVKMEGDNKITPLGELDGEGVEVIVTVKPIGPAKL